MFADLNHQFWFGTVTGRRLRRLAWGLAFSAVLVENCSSFIGFLWHLQLVCFAAAKASAFNTASAASFAFAAASSIRFQL
jgi:hypothetical protein